MSRVAMIIVGGGLSGLYAAWLLEQAGQHDYLVLEARPTLGGRIRSIAPDPDGSPQDRLDLGATWFWPDMQPNVGPLLQTLGITTFVQDDDGDMVVERSSTLPPARMQGFVTVPPAYRLRGGMGALVDAMRARLPASNLRTGMVVSTLTRNAGAIDVLANDDQGQQHCWKADQVMLALPPRLAADRIHFDPPLPPALLNSWRQMPTHMAPHAKYVACYDYAFWKEQGLSGEARSAAGPLAEIHDASQPGLPALFGFFLTPASQRQRMPREVLLQQCRAQLARMFGPQALAPRMDGLHDWAGEPFTATAECGLAPVAPSMPLPPAPAGGAWVNRLAGAGSEWSPLYPGYVAGAIDAPVRALARLRGATPTDSARVTSRPTRPAS